VFDGFGYIFTQSLSRLVDYLVMWWACLFVCFLFGWLVGCLVIEALH